MLSNGTAQPWLQTVIYILDSLTLKIVPLAVEQA